MSSWHTGVFLQNPQGGGVFFRQFDLRLAKKKNPTPNYAFLVFFISGKIKRKFLVVNDKKVNRVKIEQTIASMFGVNGPKFEEVSGVQLYALLLS